MSEYVFKANFKIDNCLTCPVANIVTNCPCFTGEAHASDFCDSKHPNCPLVELPPHGELKDTDAIVNTAKEIYCKGCNNYGGVMCRACLLDDCLSCIDDAPTILEASKA